eukprot:421246-Prymnesium_polylepis.2
MQRLDPVSQPRVGLGFRVQRTRRDHHPVVRSNKREARAVVAAVEADRRSVNEQRGVPDIHARHHLRH